MCAYACAEFPSDLTSTREDSAKEAEAPGGDSREHEPRPSVSPNFPRAPPLGMVAADRAAISSRCLVSFFCPHTDGAAQAKQ
jgi:hypothetical protein